MTPHEYCQDKAAKSGSSFYYSFLFLPELQRNAITALYAFCREVDDVVDECSDIGVARAKLSWWKEEVDKLYAGNPQHPVTLALADSLPHFKLEKQYLLEIIDGMTTGRIKGEIIDGVRKAEIIKKIADQEKIAVDQIVAVGDGANDRFMLEKAGLAIGFNPKAILKE